MITHEDIAILRARLEAVRDAIPDATPHWTQRCREMIEDASSGRDPNIFSWPSLADFSVDEFHVFTAWYYELSTTLNWTNYWKPVSRDGVLRTKVFSLDPEASPISMQHAYHMMRYVSAKGRLILDTDVVFEIGGGYGNFARASRVAGFTGPYYIFDLPHVREIQRLYLEKSGVRVNDDLDRPSDVMLIGLDDIERTLAGFSGKTVSLVATWSLSEMPIEARQPLAPVIDRADQALIAYQPIYDGMDNTAYFQDVINRNPTRSWVSMPVPNYPTQGCLFS